MDIETLRAQHPEAYAAAVKIGENRAFDLVQAHITYAEGSRDWKSAIADIKARAEITPAIQAKHFTAGMNRKAQADRQEESEFAELVVGGGSRPESNTSAAGPDLGDLVVAAMNLPPASEETRREYAASRGHYR